MTSQILNSDDSILKMNVLHNDLKNLAQVVQKLLDENINDKLYIIKSKFKPFEIKLDCIEWLSRHANFYSPEVFYTLL